MRMHIQYTQVRDKWCTADGDSRAADNIDRLFISARFLRFVFVIIKFTLIIFVSFN